MTTTVPETQRGVASEEFPAKLAMVRRALDTHRLDGIRLRRTDWFAWATCGGSSVVLMSEEVGVAEVLITRDDACVLTDDIEIERLRREELPAGLQVVASPWADPAARELTVRDLVGSGGVASDAPVDGEEPLPPDLVTARTRLLPAEIERYRWLGADVAEAMTETADRARPEMREQELAGIGAEALLRRGVEPPLILVGGARRGAIYRHPTWSDEPVGDRVMIVFCGRRHGLYANLTRIVSFGKQTAEQRRRAEAVAAVEAAAFSASTPGATLGRVYEAIVSGYAREGFPGAERDHHQGGITGYRGREAFARPGSSVRIDLGMALAWNPSLPGAKIEDTVVVTPDGLEILTTDPAWPVHVVDGRPRPAELIRG